MGVFQRLSVLALRQVVNVAGNAVGISGAGDKTVDALTKHFADHSQKLTVALERANERAWKALEIALAGDSLWERCKVGVAATEDTAFAQQVRAFLDGSPFKGPENASVFRNALKELRAARSRDLLTAGQLSFDELAKQSGSLARYDNPQVLLDAEWKVVEQTAGQLREFPNLYKVLVAKTKSGQRPSILVVAVHYYFRQEVARDPELARGLTVAKLDAIEEAQEKRFDALTAALSRQGDRLEEMLGTISGLVIDIDSRTIEIDKTTKSTQDAVQVLVGQVKMLTEQLQLQNREVRPSDSMSVRSEGERQLVKQLVAKYRSLPEVERQRLPGLLINLGKLELAAGDFAEAQQKFQTVATMESDPRREAEAHYNAYQAALQRQDWDAALASIRQAIALDAARFAPFPAEYEPTRILGAGGFGVAFLCHHKFMDENVVVKTLQSDELDCNVDRVFTEARALKRLDHPSIIRLSICGFADAGGKRPFLAMDYFDGMNLESYVEEHGPLSPEELLAVAVPVAEALKAAHAQNIYHRDVKPANILVRRDDSGWRVKLIDFGLALRPSTIGEQASTPGPRAQTTIAKTIAGTLHYAAPEQMGRSPGIDVGAYSEVYGFGKTCYYALFNAPDPDPDDEEELPESWRLLLRKCTRKDVAKRLPDFAAVLRDLAAIKNGGGKGGHRDDPDVARDPEGKRPQSWSGYWFVNVGEGEYRDWDDCRKYGFLAAGHGTKYSDPLKKLKIGYKVFAYMKGIGYVGFGEITKEAVMVKDFNAEGEKALLDLPLKQPGMKHNSDDPNMSEWVVGVKWHKALPRDEALRFQGAFANQNIVCKLREQRTLEFLKQEFGVDVKNAPRVPCMPPSPEALREAKKLSDLGEGNPDVPGIPRTFNLLLSKAGIPLGDVRLIRHKDSRADKGRAPYDLWRDNRPQFELYQSIQSIQNHGKLNAPYWAVFLSTNSNKTLFAGLYSVRYRGRLEHDQEMPHVKGLVNKAGNYWDVYDLKLQDVLGEFIGKLLIDWGAGALAWVQYAGRQDKRITEVRTEVAVE